MMLANEKINESETKKWEGFLGSTYDDFISKVGKGRGKDKTYIDSIGQGRVWTGSQGKERGLVDEYGGPVEAIERRNQPPHETPPPPHPPRVPSQPPHPLF